MKRIYQGFDRGRLCAQIERHRMYNRWVLFWPARQWAQEQFKTLAGAKRHVARIIWAHPIEWRVALDSKQER